MTWWLYAFIGVIAVFAALLFFAPQIFYPKTDVSSLGPFNLNSPTAAFDSNRALSFTQTAGASFQGFFYVIPLLRTPTAVACGTPGNPSCEDGRFHTCNCGVMKDCSSCTRTGYLPLFNVSKVCSFEVLAAPDAGRQGKAMAQLAVQTETNVDGSGNPVDASGSTTMSNSYVEFIPLPPVALQKWTMITVVREGRRFDVYYDAKLVASRKTSFMIATPDNKQPLTVGNPGFTGYSAALTTSSVALTGGDVVRSYSKLSDTRGAPYVTIPGASGAGFHFVAPTLPGGLNLSFPNMPTGLGLKLPSLCLSGSCAKTPTVRPAQPWLDWDTDYA